MSSNKRSGASNKAQYKKYSYEKNRKKKLLKLLKEQPNNKDIPAALKSIKYRRKKPINKNGWANRDLYPEIKSKSDAMMQAFVRSIVSKTNKQINHELKFGNKKKKK